MPTAVSFDEVLREAVAYFADNGFTDPVRLTYWSERLKIAARRELVSTTRVRQRIAEALRSEYSKQVDRGGILRINPDVSKETLARLRPELRQVLTNRIAASAALIGFNREEDIANTVKRFAGWASSLPNSPSPATDRAQVRSMVRRGLSEATFREARLIIDQNHKLIGNINATLAEGGGAIAAIWISHYQQHNYDYREEHRELMELSEVRPFLIRNSWAHRQGILNTVGATFTDQLPYQPGQQPFCRCYFQYIYNPRKLPPEMLIRRVA